MGKILYNKPALTFEEQLSRLEERGLIIENKEKALHILQNISYYRLSGYWYPLLEDPKSDHLFKSESSFGQAFKLYCFDRELRGLIIGELEKVEIAVRTQLIYQLSHRHGAYWFSKESIFKNKEMLQKTILKIKTETDRSQEDFIDNFGKKYTQNLPPCWMTLEVTSFGVLSSLYGNLQKDKRGMSNYFGLDDKTFSSWLHSLLYVRNICAHHSRLWNKKLRISPIIPKSPRKTFLTIPANNDKVYYILSMVLYLLNTINPNHSFRMRLKELFEKYPSVDLAALGFPEKWQEERLWGEK